MIDSFAEYLRSIRTLTAAEVDARTAAHDRFTAPPAERLDDVSQHAMIGASQH